MHRHINGLMDCITGFERRPRPVARRFSALFRQEQEILDGCDRVHA